MHLFVEKRIEKILSKIINFESISYQLRVDFAKIVNVIPKRTQFGKRKSQEMIE